MEPMQLGESLKEWVAVSLTLMELVPEATLTELIDYAKGVVSSPIAASVLATAMRALPPEETKKRPVFGSRR